MGGNALMGKCKKEQTKSSESSNIEGWWKSQTLNYHHQPLTYETLEKAVHKIGGAYDPSMKQAQAKDIAIQNEQLKQQKELYYKNLAYIKGESYTNFNAAYVPVDTSKPSNEWEPDEWETSKHKGEPPYNKPKIETEAPKSMADIYNNVDEPNHPQAGLPTTDTGDWPYNKKGKNE